MKFLPVFLFFLLLFSSCLKNITLNQSVSVKYHHQLMLDSHTLRFEDVPEDSRCPENTECVWAGEVKVLLLVDGSDGLLYTLPGDAEKTWDKYRFVLNKVEPEASESPVKKRKYKAWFIISEI